MVGAIGIYRQEVRPFTVKQIELVQNFAAQAVIAIENTRLLNELRQRTDELGRSVEELRALGEVSQAVNSTLDVEIVLSTIVAKAVQLSGTEAGAIYVFDDAQREFHLRATCGMAQELIEALKHQRIGLDDPNATLAFAQHEPVQIADLEEQATSAENEIILRAGYRALLVAPLLRGEEIVGLLVVRRRTPGAFPQNTVELMKTFAAQSAMAIQNARLFREIEEKGRELASGERAQIAVLRQYEPRTAYAARTPCSAIRNCLPMGFTATSRKRRLSPGAHQGQRQAPSWVDQRRARLLQDRSRAADIDARDYSVGERRAIGRVIHRIARQRQGHQS